MTGGVQLKGVSDVLAALRAESLTGKSYLNLYIGYRAPYAVYVHENLNASHAVGQAKFLEEPLRRLRPDMMRIIENRLRKRKRSLEDALKAAGQLLFDESQACVPVATGALRESGFMTVE